MLSVVNLSKSYGSQLLFDEVTFNINPKERVGLVGRNGYGKTTLFRIILGQEQPDSGKIAIPNNYRIAAVEQHLNFSGKTVIEESLKNIADPELNQWRVEKILTGLGFKKEDLQRNINEFSGGYQIRVNLAKVLVLEPDLLLLDEPTNYLDITAIRWLAKFLRNWKSELMLITHDRTFMDSVVTYTMAIHRKKIKKIKGDTNKIYEQIVQDEEIYEKTRINDEKRRKEIELFISKFRAKARLANLAQSRIKTLSKQQKLEKLEKIQTIDFEFSYSPFPAKVIMEIENLRFSYSGGQPYLIDNFNLIVGREDRICVIGPNGRGKTTLLKLIAGELQPLTGTIKKHSAAKIGYFGQTNIDRLNSENTVLQEILSADTDGLPQRCHNICGAMMFENDDALKKISVLSGGERSRVMLGKILVSSANLLLLDEPSNHLDMESCDSLMAAIDAFPGAVIIITHNEMFLNTFANRLIVFDRNKISVYDCSYQDFLSDIGWEADSENIEKADKESEEKKKNKE
ncbi:MAG TPA: ABC-F family ATP-binding cassette domain-containing protein, partial [bacterium]|nr:ABC-F family ATP-binding cassette domain-containing protein [bacterium]